MALPWDGEEEMDIMARFGGDDDDEEYGEELYLSNKTKGERARSMARFQWCVDQHTPFPPSLATTSDAGADFRPLASFCGEVLKKKISGLSEDLKIEEARKLMSTILVGLLTDERESVRYCKAFLRWLVWDGKKKALVLDKRESVWERSINSITTINNVWVRVMAEGDRVVLGPLRDREPDRSKKEDLRLVHRSCIGNVPSKTWPMKKVS
jgi:hypothetical protein